jgi:hypothetical protein
MRCKIFVYSYNENKMEEIINKWLSENPKAKILHLVQSSCWAASSSEPKDGGFVETTLTLFYQ